LAMNLGPISQKPGQVVPKSKLQHSQDTSNVVDMSLKLIEN